MNPDISVTVSEVTTPSSIVVNVTQPSNLMPSPPAATIANSLATGRTPRPRRVPSHLVQDHQFTVLPSLQHDRDPSFSQRTMDAHKAASVHSGKSRRTSGTVSSSKSVSPSEIQRRLAEQESRRKLHDLMRVAEEEKAQIRREAAEREEEIHLERVQIEIRTQRLAAEARLDAEHRERQVEFDFEQAEIQMETERLQRELENAVESTYIDNLPDSNPDVQTSQWLNGTSQTFEQTCISSGVVSSDVVHVSDGTGTFSVLPTQSNNHVKMHVSSSDRQGHGSGTNIGGLRGAGVITGAALGLANSSKNNVPYCCIPTAVTSMPMYTQAFSGPMYGNNVLFNPSHNTCTTGLSLQPAGFTLNSVPTAMKVHSSQEAGVTSLTQTVSASHGVAINQQPVMNPCTPSQKDAVDHAATPLDQRELPSDNSVGESNGFSGSDSDKSEEDDSSSGDISSRKGRKYKAGAEASYQYRYGMFVDSLPKLDIPKFDDEHNVKQYVTFRSLWDSIMSKPEFRIPEATKFAYMRSHLGGRPLAIADRNMILGDKAYAATIKQFDKSFGDPGRIVQGLLSQLETRPSLSYNDWAGLRDFSDELVTMIQTATHLKFKAELKNHKYAVELAQKLPDRLHTEFLSKMWKKSEGQKYTVLNLSEWLEDKTGPVGLILLEQSRKFKSGKKERPQQERKRPHPKGPDFPVTRTYTAQIAAPNPQVCVTTTAKGVSKTSTPAKNSNASKGGIGDRITCLYCGVSELGHYLETCEEFKKLNCDQKIKWLKDKGRCNKCAKKHEGECPFPKKCKDCQGDHRASLHEVVKSTVNNRGTVLCSGVGSKPKVGYERDVLIKVVPLVVYGPKGMIETFGVLDECAERTMILQQTVSELQIHGPDETLRIETVMGDADWKGKCVDFVVSARGDQSQKFQINCAFTADDFQLVDYSVSAERLQSKWPHLRNLPLFTADKVQPALLIGADHIELTLSTEVRTGPKTSSPVAVNTLFGWTVQGRQGLQQPGVKSTTSHQVLFTMCQQPEYPLHQMMERFMAIDRLPHINEKEATRSRLDKLAIKTLKEKTVQVEVQGIHRLETPLLWKPNRSIPQSSARAVQGLARSHRKKMTSDPKLAEYCKTYMQKLKDQGHVEELGTVEEIAAKEQQGWYIPYHVVHSSGKYRLVFNCSFEFAGQNLNDELLAGPTLNSSLLEVLLRFRQGRVAVSGDITAMFHQVRLSPEERCRFRFLWWDEQMDTWIVFQWLVLPFGATCSPCCATFALQKTAEDGKERYPLVQDTIKLETYVDNQLASRDTEQQAKELVLSTRQCLQESGFQMVKYASSHPEVVENLPTAARSNHHLRSLSLDQLEGNPEPALGLNWDCMSDEMYHPAKVPDNRLLTKRTALRVLASQFEPLGDIAPFTARAKIIVQELWMSKLDWDEEVNDTDIRKRWEDWCLELEQIPSLRMQRCYTPSHVDSTSVKRALHVFCDASERLYGAVAYMRSVDDHEQVYMSFVLAKCRVAPKRLTSMPRLELMAALVGAQLAQLVSQALTVELDYVMMWSDSTTVLTWIQSDSCRFKVFVGTRVAEIQTLTDGMEWRYVRTTDNPADDITRGLSVAELGKGSRWSEGPPWLLGPPDTWQSESAPVLAQTRASSSADTSEIKKALFCGVTMTGPVNDLDLTVFESWTDLVNALGQKLYPFDEQVTGALSPDQTRDVENQLLQRAQMDHFKAEIAALEAGKEISKESRLIQLAPELDRTEKLIRVGGRLRKVPQQDCVDFELHPIVLDQHHPVTKLLIKDADNHFSHQAGTGQVFAYLRRRYWIIRGRSSVKGVLHACFECRRWREKPRVPRMADLPKSRLRLHKPPFYSTGMDCFGPMTVTIGRRQEKRWGLLFKCMTTRAIHLELLEKMDADHFLMAYRRFASRRGVPYELLSDCGTNFTGAATEMENALKEMEPELVKRLAKYKVLFRFNPPNAPHFGGLWEREVRSVKTALKGVLRDRTVPEPVLRTVLTEAEGIMNSKPLGYASSEVADIDPVTPNILLMGRRDPALPMVVYDEGRRSWRHSQVLADHFWRLFIRSYLPTLQTRQKWQREVDNLSVGDVVMIADPQLTRSQWPVGVVSEVLPSSDDRVRAVNVKVDKRTYKRPVSRLVRLSKYEEGDTAKSNALLTRTRIPFKLYSSYETSTV